MNLWKCNFPPTHKVKLTAPGIAPAESEKSKSPVLCSHRYKAVNLQCAHLKQTHMEMAIFIEIWLIQ